MAIPLLLHIFTTIYTAIYTEIYCNNFGLSIVLFILSILYYILQIACSITVKNRKRKEYIFITFMIIGFYDTVATVVLAQYLLNNRQYIICGGSVILWLLRLGWLYL
jgi:hypothetical protein